MRPFHGTSMLVVLTLILTLPSSHKISEPRFLAWNSAPSYKVDREEYLGNSDSMRKHGITYCMQKEAAELPDDEEPGYWHRLLKPLPEVFEDSKVIALAEAAAKGDTSEVDRLVASGVDVNTIGKEGVTPLLYALWSDSFKGYLRLLEHKANPNHCWNGNDLLPDSVSAVHFAASRDRSTWLMVTLQHGGDPNVEGKVQRINEEGKEVFGTCMPLHYVIETSDKLHPAPLISTAMLISKGANLEKTNIDGLRPFEYHLKNGNFESSYLLLVAGTSIQGKNGDSVQALIRQVRKESPPEKIQNISSRYYLEKIIAHADLLGLDTTP